MKVVLSTRNPSKAEQIRAVFEGLPLSVLSLDDAGIEGEGVEDGTTLEENALKKAIFAWEHSRKWSMADDTGLYIDALDGQPGIRAARWAGETASTQDILNFTLEKLKDVPSERRTATFKTVAAVVSPEGKHYFFTGEVKGSLLVAPRVQPQPKMPYSALFVPNGHTKTWSEMPVEEENAISHRGQAFRQVRDFFKNM